MAPKHFNVLNALRFLIKRFNEHVTFVIKSALRRFKCLGSLNSAENVENGFGTFGKFSIDTLVACSSLEVTDKGLGRDGLPEREYTHTTQFFLPPSECNTRCSDTEVPSFGVSCWLT